MTSDRASMLLHAIRRTACLTAFAIEHMVGTKHSRPYAIESRRLVDDRLELCLLPVR